MSTLSVSIPDELKDRMANFDEINWSAIARKAFEEKVKEIELLQRLAKKSKLTEKDAEEIAATINKGIAARFRGM